MNVFRYSKSVYGGQEQMIGASWDLLPWFVGAAFAFIIIHAIILAAAKHRRRGSHQSTQG